VISFRARFAAAALILAWLVQGCVTAPPRPPVADPEAAYAARAGTVRQINSWEVKGKLAVSTDQRGGNANIIWQRSGEKHYINMYGPFGGGRVILTDDESGAKLRDNNKKVYVGKNAEEVLRRAAGWRVPFAAMQYWILGIPAPAGKFVKSLDDYGRLASLRQGGWEIRFLEYEMFDQRELPSRIVLRSLADTTHLDDDRLRENDSIEVKLLIKRWTI